METKKEEKKTYCGDFSEVYIKKSSSFHFGGKKKCSSSSHGFQVKRIRENCKC